MIYLIDLFSFMKQKRFTIAGILPFNRGINPYGVSFQ